MPYSQLWINMLIVSIACTLLNILFRAAKLFYRDVFANRKLFKSLKK